MNHTFHIIDTQTGREPDFEALKKEDWISEAAEYIKFYLNPKGQIVIYYAEFGEFLYNALPPPGRFLVVFDEQEFEPKSIVIEEEVNGTRFRDAVTGETIGRCSEGFCAFLATLAQRFEIAAYLQKKGEGA